MTAQIRLLMVYEGFLRRYICNKEACSEQQSPPVPVTLDISYVQNGICMSRSQTQRLVNSIIHLHVASSARRSHKKPKRQEMTLGH